MRSGLFLALPFAAHGVVIDVLMGLAMIAVGILLTRLNWLLKKAQADQMTQLWNERQKFGPESDPDQYWREEKRRALNREER